MNKKYFLLILTTIIVSQTQISVQDTLDTSKSIEQEKDIPESNLYHIINRDLDLYHYDIAIGAAVPLGTNISNSFDTGNSISLLIKTPYITPKILNRFTFSISSEIFLKNYKFKSSGIYDSNYNLFGFYMLLETQNDNPINIKYGGGICHINQADNNLIVPAFKLKAAYRIKLEEFYSFLINNYIIDGNENLRDLLNSVNLWVGAAPELLIGFPGRSGEMTLSTDIYFTINLFSL